MIIRPLEREELETIWTIDRSEVIHNIYQVQDGELVLTPHYFDARGWEPGKIEEDTPMLAACFDRGGAFLGMFADDKLVGVAVVDTLPCGVDRNCRELKFLYVSQAYRQRGVGTRLFEQAKAIARDGGAAFLYISAAETQSAVDFYRRRGCTLAATPDADLLAQHPSDIHFVCAL